MGTLSGTSIPAVRADARAAAAFERIALPEPSRQRHGLAYAALAAGVISVGASFAFAGEADRTFDHYEAESDPAEIARLYDRTRLFDRLSSSTLIGGEALIATGLYLRFLRRPPSARLSLEVAPSRCALAVRF